VLAKSIGGDRKGRVSMVVYIGAIPLAFLRPLLACLCYALVAVMWLIPDRRIEKAIGDNADIQ
jgi:hypothetical protein